MASLLYLHRHLFLPLVLHLLFIQLLMAPVYTAYDVCYWIDGSPANSLIPCYALDSVGASMCCQSGQCQSDGLCNQTIDTASVYYWRGACSDSTWQDPACFPIAPWITNGPAQLTICQDGTVCPRSTGDANQTCCQHGLGQIPANGDITVPLAVIQAIQASARATSSTTTTSTVTSTAISPSTSTLTVTEAPTPSQSATGGPQPQPSPPRSLGLPLGLGLGLGVLLVIGAGVLASYVRRKATPQASVKKKQEQGEEYDLAVGQVYEAGGTQRAEMGAAIGRAGRSELSPGMSEETRGMLELEGT